VLAPFGLGCIMLGLGGGFALSRGVAARAASARAVPPDPHPARDESSPEPRTVVVGAATARISDGDMAAMRALVREELAAERAAVEPRRNGPPAERGERASARALSSDELPLYDRARAAVDRGIARAAWTDEDRAQLREAMMMLPGDVQVEIVRPLTVAVNAGTVHFDGHGPLF
jgi:hypothetical protein